MFTCSTLHRWVCKSHVSDYSSMLAILRSQSRRDLPVLWRATLVSIHADEISIVIAYTKDTRKPECNYAIYRFIAIIALWYDSKIDRSRCNLDIKLKKSGKSVMKIFLFFNSENTVSRTFTRLLELL